MNMNVTAGLSKAGSQRLQINLEMKWFIMWL